MTLLGPGALADAAALPLPHEPLPAADVVAGSPTTGHLALTTIGGAEVGIWEMTPGAASDTETDEVFVVLSGRARIEFVDPPRPAVEVGPGSIVHLGAGMRTVWTVVETLRKVYIA